MEPCPGTWPRFHTLYTILSLKILNVSSRSIVAFFSTYRSCYQKMCTDLICRICSSQQQPQLCPVRLFLIYLRSTISILKATDRYDYLGQEINLLRMMCPDVMSVVPLAFEQSGKHVYKHDVGIIADINSSNLNPSVEGEQPTLSTLILLFFYTYAVQDIGCRRFRKMLQWGEGTTPPSTPLQYKFLMGIFKTTFLIFS